MTTPLELVFLAGRVLLGAYFVHAGWNHFRNRNMFAGYAASKKVPFPLASVLGTGTLLLLGGISVLLGVYPLVGLAMLALFLVGVTPQMHNFWAIQDPMMRMGERVNFLKNGALLGAVLALVAVPRPWALSLPIPGGL